MGILTVIQKFAAFARRFSAANRGAALIEFAIILPVMAYLYLATVQLTQTIIAKRKLNLAVYTLADLTSQDTEVSQTDMAAVFGSAGAVMAPLNVSGMQMRISSIIVYPTGKTCVDWSLTSGTGISPLAAGSATYVMPSGIASTSNVDTRDFIVAEMYFPFNPTTHAIPGQVTLHEGPTYVLPRKSLRVVGDSSIQSTSPCS